MVSDPRCHPPSLCPKCLAGCGGEESPISHFLQHCLSPKPALARWFHSQALLDLHWDASDSGMGWNRASQAPAPLSTWQSRLFRKVRQRTAFQSRLLGTTQFLGSDESQAQPGSLGYSDCSPGERSALLECIQPIRTAGKLSGMGAIFLGVILLLTSHLTSVSLLELPPQQFSAALPGRACSPGEG